MFKQHFALKFGWIVHTGIDLMEPVGGVWHNESGGVVTQVFPDDNWIERHKHFCVEDVVCPECHKSFNVRGLQW